MGREAGEILGQMRRTQDECAGDARKETGRPAREKHWHERGLEEKVEKLRRMVLALVSANNRLAERLEEAHYTAHMHMHDGLGRIGVPPRESFMNYPLNALKVSDHDLR